MFSRGPDLSYANTIAYNYGVGVLVNSDKTVPPGTSIDNRILSNYMYLNNGTFTSGSDLQIDLGDDGRTPNDPKDRDTGPNNLQNFPVVTSATTSTSTSKSSIAGTLNSTPRKTFTIQFYDNSSSFGYFIGETTVKTNRKGKASFTFSPPRALSVVDNVTATATDANGNTSEFSDPKAVTAA